MPEPRRVRVITRPLPARIPPGAVYVGRRAWGLPGTPFGNPWIAGKNVPDVATALERYRLKCLAEPAFLEAADAYIDAADVACFCPLPGPGEPDLCHGAVLLELLAGRREPHDLEPWELA